LSDFPSSLITLRQTVQKDTWGRQTGRKSTTSIVVHDCNVGDPNLEPRNPTCN